VLSERSPLPESNRRSLLSRRGSGGEGGNRDAAASALQALRFFLPIARQGRRSFGIGALRPARRPDGSHRPARIAPPDMCLEPSSGRFVNTRSRLPWPRSIASGRAALTRRSPPRAASRCGGGTRRQLPSATRSSRGIAERLLVHNPAEHGCHPGAFVEPERAGVARAAVRVAGADRPDGDLVPGADDAPERRVEARSRASGRSALSRWNLDHDSKSRGVTPSEQRTPPGARHGTLARHDPGRTPPPPRSPPQRRRQQPG
jgi:hypothetical protein